MKCYEPSEQLFKLKDMSIGIDWGKGGDKAIMTKIRYIDGKFTVTEIKEMKQS